MNHSFKWTCSYMGSQWFQVTDETGTYEAELRRVAEPYELSIANGDDVRQCMKTAIGILRRSHPIKIGADSYSFSVPADTVAAFNAWRKAEHDQHVAEMRAQPGRYGIIGEEDLLAKRPMVATGGLYVFGESRWIAE